MKPSRLIETFLLTVMLSLGACGTTPPTKFFLLGWIFGGAPTDWSVPASSFASA